jgi:hypothetical protein
MIGSWFVYDVLILQKNAFRAVFASKAGSVCAQKRVEID